MAQKRMFDKAILDTDRFMDMPMSAKALYFLLGMEADDEGFVSYKKVMRVHGGNEDDLNVLMAKQFVIRFPSGVIVITEWRKNNWLDTRRVKPTEYQREKAQLSLDIDDKYMLSNGLASVEESRVEQKSIAPATPSPFVFSNEIKKLEDSERRDLNIIALYFEEKKPDIRNREQLSVAIKRHLRSARSLSAFTDDQIVAAIPKARKITEEWTIETLVKVLTK